MTRTDTRPNIIFLHVDQLTSKAISAYGCKDLHTPNIHKMIENGMSFMNSYSANPVCCPARASWYTGRASTEHGIYENSYPINEAIPDIGPWMTKAGYESVYAGKWHVNNRKLDESFDVIHLGTGQGEVADAECVRACQTYLRAREDDKPFFLNVGLLNPHDCCFWFDFEGGPGKYAFAENLKRPLPELPVNFDKSALQTNKMRPQQQTWTERDWRYYIYSYYRMTEMVDMEIGKLLTTLENSPYADNTVLIFSADHGDGCGYHNYCSKGVFYEEVAQVPLVICYPGKIAKNKRVKHLVGGYDIAPTICDFAGAPPLPDLTISRSVKPICEGQDVPWRDYLAIESFRTHTGTMIRTDRYKALFLAKGALKDTLLFDMADDPMEMKNLAKDPAHAETLKTLEGMKADYESRIDPIPEPPEGWDKFVKNCNAKGKRTAVKADDEE
jgi:choline-sulfatase